MQRARKLKAHNLILAGLALFFLVAPTGWAGHGTVTSPAGFSQTIDAFDGVAIRGMNGRISTGPTDVQVGLAGYATGDAAAFQAMVVGGFFRTFGSATQPQASVRAIDTGALGNATAESSNVTSLTAGTNGSAEGPNSTVMGVNIFSQGSATGQGAKVIALHAPTPGSATGSGSSVIGLEASMTGNATGPGSGIAAFNSFSTGSAIGNEAQVQVIRAQASGNAVGQDSLVRGVSISTTGNATGNATIVEAIRGSASGNAVGAESVVRGGTFSTSGHANGSASAVQSVRVRALGNAVGADSAVTGVAVTAEGVATGSGSVVSGVRARTLGASGPAVAVYAETNSPQGIGVHGISNNPAGVAGRFDGRIVINCTSRPCLTVNGRSIGDLAENMIALGRTVPGDVVVLAQGRNNKWGVARATRPYDTRVAGIVTAQPSILLQVRGTHTVPVAMVGIVTAKATASGGQIKVGDLLTTSAIPGRLMRCSNPARCIGAVVAKALEPLRSGSGSILVLVWRQ